MRTTSTSLRVLTLAFTLCGGAAVALPACTPRQPPPALASGEKPVTGVPRFDRLFTEINAALLAVQDARREEADARGALARRLGLPENVAVDVLGERLRERTAHLAQEGLTLELEFTGIDDPYEAPVSPEISCDTVTYTPEENAHQILDYLIAAGFVQSAQAVVAPVL